jgi:glucokinase
MSADGGRKRAPTRYVDDPRVVLTLDAGGTNLVFCAVQGEREIVSPVTLSAQADTVDEFLELLVTGFRRVREQVPAQAGARADTPTATGARAAAPAGPVAISFAFPGPADYGHGIIGDLVNLPAFRGGVPLGPALEDEFGVPVFISNDGDLFALGESIAGFLPQVNGLLEQAGSPRRYRNLLGVTFGTGFGAGIVSDGRLHEGDNSAAGEINRLRNRLVPAWTVEESVSIRGVRRVYARESGIAVSACPTPEEINEIGLGRREGDRTAAERAFEELAMVAGDALAAASSLVDGLVVIGGGLAHGHRLFMTRLVREMNAAYDAADGGFVPRFESRAYDLEDPADRAAFLRGDVRELPVPRSSRTVLYDAAKAVAVGVTVLGTGRAVSVGAYTLALARIDGG